LRASAGLVTLSAHEVLAADVNRSGAVTAMDAAHILEKSVGLIDGPFPGAGRLWDFAPQQRSYPLLNSDRANQNFTAVLIGDVSGNWQAGAPGPQLQGAQLQGAQLQGAQLQGAQLQGLVGLSLPEITASQGDSGTLPLSVERMGSDIFSLDLVLTYDPALLRIESVTAGDAAGNMGLAANLEEAGIVRVGLAGSEPLAQDGVLVDLAFEVIGELTGPTDVAFERSSINEGAVSVFPQPGRIVPRLTADLTGNGFVDFQDLTILLANWNQSVSAAEGNLVDAGGTPVNFQDLTVLLAAWTGPGPGASPQAAVTELPSSDEHLSDSTPTRRTPSAVHRRIARRPLSQRDESPLRRLQATDRAMADYRAERDVVSVWRFRRGR
jgi:hypothetical protein